MPYTEKDGSVFEGIYVVLLFCSIEVVGQEGLEPSTASL